MKQIYIGSKISPITYYYLIEHYVSLNWSDINSMLLLDVENNCGSVDIHFDIESKILAL